MPENPNQKIKITLKVSGIEIELECLPDQIEDAVQNALKGIKATNVSDNLTQLLQKNLPSTTGKINVEGYTFNDSSLPKVVPRTCKELLMVLHKENWFKQDRGLGEVATELARRGFNYDRSAVSHTLLDMTRLGWLTRQGGERRYRYINKKPPLMEHDKQRITTGSHITAIKQEHESDRLEKDMIFVSNALQKRKPKMDISDLQELMTKNPKKYKQIIDEIQKEELISKS